MSFLCEALSNESTSQRLVDYVYNDNKLCTCVRNVSDVEVLQVRDKLREHINPSIKEMFPSQQLNALAEALEIEGYKPCFFWAIEEAGLRKNLPTTAMDILYARCSEIDKWRL